MNTHNLRRHYETTEKEEPTLISTEKAKRPCKCTKLDHRDPNIRNTLHRKEVFSDGWTRWVCSKCGQVKFSKGMMFEEGK